MTRTPENHRPAGSGSRRLLAGAALIGLLGGMAVIVLASGGGGPAETQAVVETTAPPTTPQAPPRTEPVEAPVAVTGVGAFDPEGDQSENDSEAALATDGKLATAWKSERYRRSFAKTGVGLVLDAGRPVRANRVVVATETPGYTAEVRVGPSPEGPFVAVSKEQATKARTTFALRPRSGRYLMLWITSMPDDGAAAVNEITVTAAR